MALQVWLPLNENLENKGLNMMTFSNSGSSTIVIDNNGKIGKCYKRSSIQTAGRIISNSTINLNGNLSMFCWAKVTACVGNTANGLISNHSHANNTGFGITVKQVSSSDFRISCNTGNGSSRTYMSYYGTSNIKDKWCHLGLTYDNTKHEFKLWVNGICEKTVTYTNSSRDDYLIVFDWSTTYNSDSYKPACFINDVRIYDHCLSPKEVKELSKGLVLHYKLDDIGSNINLLPVSFQRLSINGTTSSNEYMNLCSTLQIYETYGLVPYTISFEIKSAVPHSFNIYGNYGSNPKYSFSSKSINVTTEWQRFSHTFTPYISNSSGTWAGISVYGTYGSGAIVSVRNVKFELGIKSTPITNQTNIIYDCSGYENNGSILGQLTVDENSPKYNYSTNFDGNTAGILIENLYIGNIINTALTYSFWIKPNRENGARSVYFGSYSSTTFNIEKNTSNKLRLYWGGSPDLISNLTITDNQWQHIVITKNGTTEIKVYLNGELIQTLSNTYNNITFPTTFRLGRDSRSGDGTPYKGLMSDFRIYSTVLSDSDILELYNNPANIDNQGNMFSFEFDEEEVNKQQILKTGITKINNFVEINDKIKVLNDGSVFLQILHHNNPATNLFTSVNCWQNNTENLYSALVLLKTIFKNFTEYEFLACEKAESSTTSETQFRWKQTSNPALSSTITGKTIISGSVTYNQGLKTNGSYAAIHNGSTWWCACGSYTAYSGGIPGFNGVIKSGYLDLYIRISEEMLKGEIGNNLKFFNKSILSTKIIEK